MKAQAIATVIVALAGNSIALPKMGDISLEEMGLEKRAVSAATCLRSLCCPNRKRDLQEHQKAQSPQKGQAMSSEQQAQCLICWSFGVCDRESTQREGETGRVTVEVTNNIQNQASNNENPGGFWVRRRGRDYWIDQNGSYWEWKGGDDDGGSGNWRMGGHGTLTNDGDRWNYVFED
ncbi:hypothetical protein HRG_001213 [Hirsutella rhossiliensis]|uniref:Uncharacterized protein n=1 Tax=Hirsutella rhossiliensis TaxID=111463 RepID=A0A9P8SPU6_9HYPO|nr:uncharacterized protein HRG_01213 [Hirsutella rhossiliensis]KAH0968571.1 hypothetical protein HRG_01213 [Hirsutella rhossiliensis]